MQRPLHFPCSMYCIWHRLRPNIKDLLITVQSREMAIYSAGLQLYRTHLLVTMQHLISLVLMSWQGNRKWNKLSFLSFSPLSLVTSILWLRSPHSVEVNVDFSSILLLKLHPVFLSALESLLQTVMNLYANNIKNMKSGIVLRCLTFGAFFYIPVYLVLLSITNTCFSL